MKIQSKTKSIFGFINEDRDPINDYQFKAEKDEKQSIYPQQHDTAMNAMKALPLTQGGKSVDKKNTADLLIQQTEKYDNKLS